MLAGMYGYMVVWISYSSWSSFPYFGSSGYRNCDVVLSSRLLCLSPSQPVAIEIVLSIFLSVEANEKLRFKLVVNKMVVCLRRTSRQTLHVECRALRLLCNVWASVLYIGARRQIMSGRVHWWLFGDTKIKEVFPKTRPSTYLPTLIENQLQTSWKPVENSVANQLKIHPYGIFHTFAHINK